MIWPCPSHGAAIEAYYVHHSISRTQFLRGDFRGSSDPIRPPWALAEAAFTDACSRCGDCIRACPEKIIIKGRSGFPEVDFRRGECSFCGECAAHCGDAALLRDDSAPWLLRAVVTAGCLGRQGVVCMSCKEQCPHSAIRIRPQAGGVAIPEVDPLSCTGCGACYQPCPVGAIALRPTATAEDFSR